MKKAQYLVCCTCSATPLEMQILSVFSSKNDAPGIPKLPKLDIKSLGGKLCDKPLRELLQRRLDEDRHFGKYNYCLSCQELDEKIGNTFLFVQQT